MEPSLTAHWYLAIEPSSTGHPMLVAQTMHRGRKINFDPALLHYNVKFSCSALNEEYAAWVAKIDAEDV